MTSDLSFEAALEKLEAIAAQLENGDLTLDQSLAQYEVAIRLSRVCAARLDDAESRLRLLSEEGQFSEPMPLPGTEDVR